MKLPSVDPFQLLKENSKKIIPILQNLMSVLVGLVIERTAIAIALILIARKVMPIEYGQYLSTFSLITFLAVFPGLGLDSWLLAQGCGEKYQQETLWSNLIRSRVRVFILWAIGITLLSFLLPQDTYPRGLLLIIMLGVIFDTLNLLSIATLRCQDKNYTVAVLLGFSSISTLLIAAFLPRSTNTLTLFAVGRSSISFITFLLGCSFISFRTLIHSNSTFPLKDILHSARPFLWADVSSVVYVRADINIIGLTVGSKGNSIYGPAVNILQMVFLVPRSIYYYVVPKLAISYHEKKSSFKSLSILQLLAQFLLGLCLSLFLYYFGSTLILWTFGEAYSPSIEVLRILSLLPLIRSVNFAFAAILATSQNQQSRTRVQIMTASFNVIANIIAVQHFGISAVAWIYVISEIMLLVGYSVIIWVKRLITIK